MKKVLIVTSVASMIKQFNMRNIIILQNMGYEVHIATNFDKPGTITNQKSLELKAELQSLKVHWFQIDFQRGFGTVKGNIKAYQQIKTLITLHKYQFVHTQAAISSAITRFVTRSTKNKVIYTAHGFQFLKGGPMKDWILFYPIERILSKYTDILITVNKEDYERAKKFNAEDVKYVNGVGIDVESFSVKVDSITKKKLRKSLNIPNGAKLMISVGELNKNKNQESVIRAMDHIKFENLYYIIVGQGSNFKELERIVNKLNLKNKVQLLGFRSDIKQLLAISDFAIAPSYREGLMVAGMEAMASGLPLAFARTRGIEDYSIQGVTGFGFNPKSINSISDAIKNIYDAKLGGNAQNVAKEFDMKIIDIEMKKIYERMDLS